MNWEIGIDIYTLTCIKQITNNSLLYKKKKSKKKKNQLKKKVEGHSKRTKEQATASGNKKNEGHWLVLQLLIRSY